MKHVSVSLNRVSKIDQVYIMDYQKERGIDYFSTHNR